jgi:DnaJ-class molecular chaperone
MRKKRTPPRVSKDTAEVICVTCAGAGLASDKDTPWQVSICSACNGNGRYDLTTRVIDGVVSRSISKRPFPEGAEGSQVDPVLGATPPRVSKDTAEVICISCAGAGLAADNDTPWKVSICSVCNGNGRYELTTTQVDPVLGATND